MGIGVHPHAIYFPRSIDQHVPHRVLGFTPRGTLRTKAAIVEAGMDRGGATPASELPRFAASEEEAGIHLARLVESQPMASFSELGRV